MEAAPVARASSTFEVLLLPLRHTGEDIDRVLGAFIAARPAALAGRVAARHQAHHRARAGVAGGRPRLRREGAARPRRASPVMLPGTPRAHRALRAPPVPRLRRRTWPFDNAERASDGFAHDLPCTATSQRPLANSYRNDAAISRSLSRTACIVVPGTEPLSVRVLAWLAESGPPCRRPNRQERLCRRVRMHIGQIEPADAGFEGRNKRRHPRYATEPARPLHARRQARPPLPPDRYLGRKRRHDDAGAAASSARSSSSICTHLGGLEGTVVRLFPGSFAM